MENEIIQLPLISEQVAWFLKGVGSYVGLYLVASAIRWFRYADSGTGFDQS